MRPSSRGWGSQLLQLEIFPLIIGIHRVAFSRFDGQLLGELKWTEYLLYPLKSAMLT